MLYGALNFDTDKIFTTPNVTEQAYFINLIVSNDIDAVFRKVELISVISTINFKCRKFNRVFGEILYNSNAVQKFLWAKFGTNVSTFLKRRHLWMDQEWHIMVWHCLNLKFWLAAEKIKYFWPAAGSRFNIAICNILYVFVNFVKHSLNSSSSKNDVWRSVL